MRRDVRKCINALAPGGGYILSGLVPEDWPLENVMALYDEAVKYGVYSRR